MHAGHDAKQKMIAVPTAHVAGPTVKHMNTSPSRRRNSSCVENHPPSSGNPPLHHPSFVFHLNCDEDEEGIAPPNKLDADDLAKSLSGPRIESCRYSL